GVKSSVAGGDIYVTSAGAEEPTSRLPDAATLAIWCIVPDRDLMQRGGVESHYPAMIEAVIVVGGPRQVNYSLGEQQGWTLQLDFCLESDLAIAAAASASWDRTLDHNRTLKLLRAAGAIDRMYTMNVVPVLLSRGKYHRHSTI